MTITSTFPRVNSDESREVQLEPNCRFGITAPRGLGNHDLGFLGVGAYLDWGTAVHPNHPVGVDYIQVLRVRDDLYPSTLMSLAELVRANPGTYWLIGNEPDTTYEEQDGVTADVYARRYFLLAKLIRQLDPKAKTGFGGIVQATPIRMRYLDRAWEKLIDLAGSKSRASQLIDFWNIHAFILNEWPGEWGTGLPPGFEDDYKDAVHFSDPPFNETHSPSIFADYVRDFRAWMAGIGEREKPLWITEFGSLFPPIDPPGGPNLMNVSDEETVRFMEAAFAFLLQARDKQTGMPGDGYRLVQRWFWYSLDDYRYRFGGSLFDPEAQGSLTFVGHAYLDYLQGIPVGPDFLPVKLIPPIQRGFDYYFEFEKRVEIQITNIGTESGGAGSQIWVFAGHPRAGGLAVGGPIQIDKNLSGCGGSLRLFVSLDWDQLEKQRSIYILVHTPGDINPYNDLVFFSLDTTLPLSWSWGLSRFGGGLNCLEWRCCAMPR
ncbi:MAG: hypothetical protein AB1345_08075 [Chloroflexota bacterium]